MPQSEISQKVAELASPLAASLGLDLWGVEVQIAGRSIVRVFVEAESGVNIDQCAELSRLLGLGLEVEDCVPGAYFLEVSSPGLERVFFTEKQLASALGRRVELSLSGAHPDFPGRRKFRGELLSFAEGVFVLAGEDMVRPDEEMPKVRFAFSQVKKAKQVLDLPEKAQPGKKPGAKPGKAKKTASGKNAEASEQE